LIAKGVSWSKYTSEGKELVKSVFKQILDSGKVFETVRNFYQTHLKFITASLKSEDWRALIAKYCSLTKLSGKSNTVKSLLDRYDINTDRVFTIEKLGRGKVADLTCLLNDPELRPDEINFTKMLKSFLSSVSKLTFKFRDMHSDVQPDEMVNYRIETWVNGFVQQDRNLSCSLGDFISLTCPDTTLTKKDLRNTSYHEVFVADRPYRFFLDADGCDRKYLDAALTRINQMLNVDDINWVISSSRATSFHAISNLSMSLNMMSSIVKSLNLKYLDTGVYSVGRSLQFIHCPKRTRGHKCMRLAGLVF
jgi:hypothetical protein